MHRAANIQDETGTAVLDPSEDDSLEPSWSELLPMERPEMSSESFSSPDPSSALVFFVMPAAPPRQMKEKAGTKGKSRCVSTLTIFCFLSRPPAPPR